MSIWWGTKQVIQIPSFGVDFVYLQDTLVWTAVVGVGSVLLLSSIDELADPNDRLLLSGPDFTPPDGLRLSGAINA